MTKITHEQFIEYLETLRPYGLGDETFNVLFNASLHHQQTNNPVMQEGKEDVSGAELPNPDTWAHEGKWYTTGASLRICPTCFKEYASLTTGSQDCPNCSGLELPPNFTDITSIFIEQARDAEMKLISELFKTTIGEELTEQNAHRVGIDYGINRSISIDGVIIGRFKQDMLPTDNGYKCSITFVPSFPRSAPPNDPGAHSMNC